MVFIVWIGVSLLVGGLASGKGRSFWGWFFLSLVFSPIIGLIALLVAGQAK